VFFDNLAVQYKQGPLLEENHYYPYGLTMAGISDKAVKTQYAENKYRYNNGTELQNKEFFDGSGLELYTTDHRLFDPQLGKFVQVDAYADVFANWSPYTYANDDPSLLNDPTGLLSDSTHPQELAQATVTHTTTISSNNIIFADPRPLRRNPNYILGNQPAFIHYTPSNHWNYAILHKDLPMFKAVGFGLSLIPAAKGVRVAYGVLKLLQGIEEAGIPETAEKVTDNALNKNGATLKGWKGGGVWDNDGSAGGEELPKTDADGNPITYKEYDVWPKVPGQGRGTERIVIGSDNSAYYTDDHYKTFTQIR